jgi:small-conductance mechanosensitive channel
MKNGKSQNSRSEIDLDERALRYLEKSRATTVEELYAGLRIGAPSLTKAEVTDMVWLLAAQNKVNLQEALPRSFVDFLRAWQENLWFYASLGVSFVTILVIYFTPPEIPFLVLRWTLGSAFILFIPGYVTLQGLYLGDRTLDFAERIALSVAVSLVLLMLVGLLLNYTTWGIRLTPILISLTLLTLVIAAMALTRRYMSRAS